MRFLPAAVALLGVCHVRAAAVFAHFMVSNAQNYSLATWEADIGMAQAAHIDAFALNIAYTDVGTMSSLELAFQAAQKKGFRLFLSFDYAGGGPWPVADVRTIARQYIGSASYYSYKGKPMVSTFEGPGNASDWVGLKKEMDCFFIPDWSSLGAAAAMKLGVADGLFSWAAWAWGSKPMDTYVDASYRYYLGHLPYMMPVSPWFYTNLPGFNKNWLWRGDNAWYDRWTQILWWKPEFVEIISWNDYGESHYIGPLYDNAMGLFSKGKSNYNYASNMPHDGWRFILPFVIDMYKHGSATVTQEGVVSWYRLSPAAACGSGYTSANTASQLQIEFQPTDVVEDAIYFTAVLGSPADVRVTVGGASLPARWSYTPHGGVGLYHGSVSFVGHTGSVVINLVRNGASFATINGAAISTSCPNSLTNWNAWVGLGTGGSVSAAATPLSELVCTNGTGANNFKGLCNFACKYGVYCPWEACVCLQLGTLPGDEPKDGHPRGFPLAGEDESYSGLCSYDCSHGYCPPSACGTASAALSTPTVSDFEPLACTGGTGPGQLADLCRFTCGYGFCPVAACQCTAQGPLPAQPPATRTVVGLPAAGLSVPAYSAVCSYACEHGHCPTAACTSVVTGPKGNESPPPEPTGKCALKWSTGSAATDKQTWYDSGAPDWLTKFLKTNGVIRWANNFFETVLSTSGTTVDCINYPNPGCLAPPAKSCPNYNPPAGFFIHISMSNLYASMLGFHSDLSDMVEKALTTAIDDITHIFAKPDPSAAMALQILTGAITTIAGASTLVGNFGFDGLAIMGDSLAVMSAFFSDLAIQPADDGSVSDTLKQILGDAINTLKDDMVNVAAKLYDPQPSPEHAQDDDAVSYIVDAFRNGAWLDNSVYGKAMKLYSASVKSTLFQFLVVQAMASGQGDDYTFLYSTDLFNTEEDCRQISAGTWYDNTCIAFGVYHRVITPSGSGVQWTSFLSGDALAGLKKYVPDIPTALINNYECHKSHKTDPDWSGLKFDPHHPVVYPPCFWNLPGAAISPIG